MGLAILGNKKNIGIIVSIGKNSYFHCLNRKIFEANLFPSVVPHVCQAKRKRCFQSWNLPKRGDPQGISSVAPGAGGHGSSNGGIHSDDTHRPLGLSACYHKARRLIGNLFAKSGRLSCETGLQMRFQGSFLFSFAP